jgi:DNA processing protein
MSTLFSHFSNKINQIAPQEQKYLQILDGIALTPKILYYYGTLPENMVKTVAIVGSRHNTRYGEEVAYKLAYELAKEGVIVVSGLAYGIDSIAHRGCLDAGGTTIAVLGTPIDKIYPRAHTGLAREIIEKGGAVMSEYPPANGKNTLSKENPDPKYSFLFRNRIISGLADAVVVVEAAERSGSLNTATHALEQGKEVFAVPGNITSPYSQGCNKLIREGATPCTSPDDVLDYLFPERIVKKHRHAKAHKLIGDNDVETIILGALYSGASKSDEIMGKTHLPPEVFSEAASMLEIKGRIRPLGVGAWALQ